MPDGAAWPRVELLSDLYITDDIDGDGDGEEDAYLLLNESAGGTGQPYAVLVFPRPFQGLYVLARELYCSRPLLLVAPPDQLVPNLALGPVQ